MQHERYTLPEPLKLTIHRSRCVSRFRKLGDKNKIIGSSSSICELVNEPVAFRKTYWASDASRTSARATVRWWRFSSTMALLETEKGHICSGDGQRWPPIHIIDVIYSIGCDRP